MGDLLRYMMASTPHDWRYPEPAAAANMKPLVKAFGKYGAAGSFFLQIQALVDMMSFESQNFHLSH